MANKRISELQPITAAELETADLLLLSDLTAFESKKLQLQDLSDFLFNYGMITASLNGTASWATNALYASMAPYQITASYTYTSSYADNANTASFALGIDTASYSNSGSYAVTASYALTASYMTVVTSAFADYAGTASFLNYTNGMNNGTASCAVTASYVPSSTTASYALTASHVLNATTVDTASYALISNVSVTAQTASYLEYTGVFNGTASYALTAPMRAGQDQNYGVHTAMTQSTYYAQLNDVYILATDGVTYSSSIGVTGTVILPITAGVATDGLLELKALDKQSGMSRTLDSTPVYALSDMSGAFKFPFTLVGQDGLYDHQMIYITASNGISLHSRPVKFDINSYCDRVTVSSTYSSIFQVSRASTLMYYTGSTSMGEASASQLVLTGSDTILDIDISNRNIYGMQFIWTLSNLTNLNCSYNAYLSNIGGLPNSIITMSCVGCAISKIPSLRDTSLSILNCATNNFTSLPELPATMSYINCSYNSLTALPTTIPYGTTELIANNTSITTFQSSLPTSLITMSANNNASLTAWYSTIPSSVKYFDTSNCNLSQAAVESICSQLVTNAQSGGFLEINNNNGRTSVTDGYLATLISRGWDIPEEAVPIEEIPIA